MGQIQEFITFAKNSSPVLLVLVIALYFGKTGLESYLQKRFEGLASRVEEIAKTSLDIKKDLRQEERGELVGFRVALERWEDFLLTGLFDYTMYPPSEVQVRDLYDKDHALFLDVRVELVKACVYLRDEKLEQDLRQTIIDIRKLYYPIIMQSLPRLIELQAQLMPLEMKLKNFQESGGRDPAFAPTQADAENSARLQSEMTSQLKTFADALLAQYQPMAERLDTLKEGINKYIYRRVRHADVDVE